MADTLRNGDILVFRAGEEWLSKIIARLTESDVSHAAMVYDSQTVVEMGLSGIQLNTFNVSEGNAAYVMRLDPELDPRPLTDAADQYVNAKTRYDIPALVILGGLLIYRSIRPTPEFVMVTDLVLRAASRALDKLIQTVILHNPDKAMVCSQLVYQIYNDCARDYHIYLEGGVFQAGRNETDTIRLIDLVKDTPKEMEAFCVNAVETSNESGISHVNGEDDQEELFRLLWKAMQEQVDENVDESVMLDSARSLISPARKLLEQLEEFLEKTKSDIPIDALFVTPADFVYHAKNLRLVKTVNIDEN